MGGEIRRRRMQRAINNDWRAASWRGGWRLLLALTLALGLLSGGLPLANVARAASYTCDEAGLDAALADGGLVTFTCTAATTITVSATKAIAKDMILDGGGLITISGDNTRQIFTVAAGVTATIRNLTITKGKATNDDGGGIRNEGTLALTGVALVSNVTSGGNGAGVSNSGTLTVANSTITNNLTTSTKINNNDVGGAGSVYNAGTLTVTGSTLYNNSAGQGSNLSDGQRARWRHRDACRGNQLHDRYTRHPERRAGVPGLDARWHIRRLSP
jgi:hypothetical protein